MAPLLTVKANPHPQTVEKKIWRRKKPPRASGPKFRGEDRRSANGFVPTPPSIRFRAKDTTSLHAICRSHPSHPIERSSSFVDVLNYCIGDEAKDPRPQQTFLSNINSWYRGTNGAQIIDGLKCQQANVGFLITTDVMQLCVDDLGTVMVLVMSSKKSNHRVKLSWMRDQWCVWK